MLFIMKLMSLFLFRDYTESRVIYENNCRKKEKKN